MASGFGSRISVVANEARLGAADRWQIEKQAKVGGDTKTARVGDSVAIEHEQVWSSAEPFPGLEEGRCLTEAEQTGNVGEIDGRPDGH